MRVDIEKKNKSRIFAAVKGYSLSWLSKNW